ncbi:MAG: glycerol-3-phosphate dehydrogenase/oxidase [Nitrososphaerales archaeon]
MKIRDFSETSKRIYDIIIIGGGIVGTGIAREAARRGFKVILFEKEDFSYGTTAKSSRLIHGGLRYLEMLDFKLVFKDLQEREKLLKLAPHLIHPLPFLIPVYKDGPKSKLKLKLGMLIYDLLSYNKSLPSHKFLSASQVLKVEPKLKGDGLIGAFLYYDCQVPFVERLSIENVVDALNNGAIIFNHAEVKDLIKDDRKILGVRVNDKLSFKEFDFYSKIVVNATGPWAKNITNGVNNKNLLITTKGIHFTAPKATKHAIVLYSRAEERLFFVIPWYNYSLVGTTDTYYSGDLDEVKVEKEDMDYLLKEVKYFLPHVDWGKIYFTYAGVRPLVKVKNTKSPSKISRAYKIFDHGSEGLNGLISVLGVKITSYRLASEETVNLIEKKLSLRVKSKSDIIPLPGAMGINNFSLYLKEKKNYAVKFGLSEDQIEYLINIYGSRFNRIIDIIIKKPKLKERICKHNLDIMAQVFLAVRDELALTVSDFMFRRVPIAYSECQGLDGLEKVVSYMGEILSWDDEKIKEEISSYKKEVEKIKAS